MTSDRELFDAQKQISDSVGVLFGTITALKAKVAELDKEVEDLRDVIAAKKAEAEAFANGETPIPWETARQELNTDSGERMEP